MHVTRKRLLIAGHGVFLQNVYYTSTQRLHVGVLSPTVDDDDNKCLVDVNGRPRLIECSYAAAKRMKLHWLFTQVTADNATRVQRAEFSASCLYSASTEGALLNVQLVIHQRRVCNLTLNSLIPTRGVLELDDCLACFRSLGCGISD